MSVLGLDDAARVKRISAYKDTPEYYLEMARIYLANNNLPKAKSFLEKAMASKSLKQNDRDEARKLLKICNTYTSGTMDISTQSLTGTYLTWQAAGKERDWIPYTYNSKGLPVFNEVDQPVNRDGNNNSIPRMTYSLNATSPVIDKGPFILDAGLSTFVQDIDRINFPFYVYGIDDPSKAATMPDSLKALNGTYHDLATFKAWPTINTSLDTGLSMFDVVSDDLGPLSWICPMLVNTPRIGINNSFTNIDVTSTTGYKYDSVSGQLVSQTPIKSTFWMDRLDLTLSNDTRRFSITSWPDEIAAVFNVKYQRSFGFRSASDAMYILDNNWVAPNTYEGITLTDAQRAQLALWRKPVMDQRAQNDVLTASRLDLTGTLTLPGLYQMFRTFGMADEMAIPKGEDEQITVTGRYTLTMDDQLRNTENGFYPSALYVFPDYKIDGNGNLVKDRGDSDNGYYGKLPGYSSNAWYVQFDYKPRLGYLGKLNTFLSDDTGITVKDDDDPSKSTGSDDNIIGKILTTPLIPLVLLDRVLFKYIDNGHKDSTPVFLPLSVGFGKEDYSITNITSGDVFKRTDDTLMLSAGLEVGDFAFKYTYLNSGTNKSNNFNLHFRF